MCSAHVSAYICVYGYLYVYVLLYSFLKIVLFLKNTNYSVSYILVCPCYIILQTLLLSFGNSSLSYGQTMAHFRTPLFEMSAPSPILSGFSGPHTVNYKGFTWHTSCKESCHPYTRLLRGWSQPCSSTYLPS